MKLITTDGRGVETASPQISNMESSIKDTMRRYFQSDSGKPINDLEYAIMESVKRYFEGPSQ